MSQAVWSPSGGPPESGKKAHLLTFRVRSGLREKLQAAAAENQRSISEEVEHKLIISFEREATAAIFFGGRHNANLLRRQALAIALVEEQTRKTWVEDDHTRIKCYFAAAEALKASFDLEASAQKERHEEENKGSSPGAIAEATQPPRGVGLRKVKLGERKLSPYSPPKVAMRRPQVK